MLLQDSSRPLYEQMKQMLIGDIVSEVFKHGEKLPSEIKLAEQYGISRITVRRALAELVEEGYLSCQQGKGTYVKFVRGTYRLLSFGGFKEQPQEPAIHRKSRVLSKRIMEAGTEIGRYLQVPPSTSLVCLERLMSENEKPYVIDTAYFIQDMYPGLFDLLQDDVSTFALMRERYGIVFSRAIKELGVIRCGVEEARLLECVPGDPLFSISKVIFGTRNVPIHYSNYLVLGDRCVYTLTVTNDDEDMRIHYKDEPLEEGAGG